MEKDGIDLQMTPYTMPTNQDGSLSFGLYVLRRAKWQSFGVHANLISPGAAFLLSSPLSI